MLAQFRSIDSDDLRDDPLAACRCSRGAGLCASHPVKARMKCGLRGSWRSSLFLPRAILGGGETCRPRRIPAACRSTSLSGDRGVSVSAAVIVFLGGSSRTQRSRENPSRLAFMRCRPRRRRHSVSQRVDSHRIRGGATARESPETGQENEAAHSRVCQPRTPGCLTHESSWRRTATYNSAPTLVYKC